MPGLHRPPAAGERGLMSARKDDLEHIRKYIQQHEPYFEALGFQRPGGPPAVLHGAAARGVAAGPGQGRKTEAGRSRPGTGPRPGATGRPPRGMSEEARDPARQHQVPGPARDSHPGR